MKPCIFCDGLKTEEQNKIPKQTNETTGPSSLEYKKHQVKEINTSSLGTFLLTLGLG